MNNQNINESVSTVKILVMSDFTTYERVWDPGTRIVEVDEAIFDRENGRFLEFLDENPEAIISEVSLTDLV